MVVFVQRLGLPKPPQVGGRLGVTDQGRDHFESAPDGSGVTSPVHDEAHGT